ncbi:hypothetical protein ACICHK_17205 [Streptomyces sp. AHU1]
MERQHLILDRMLHVALPQAESRDFITRLAGDA